MRWQRVRAVELYRECTADEAVRVYAVVYNTGGMLVVEELAGELAAWCFGYTPHYRVLPLSPGDASLLGACLGVKGTRQLANRYTYSRRWTAIALTKSHSLPRKRGRT